mgnify:CR=1 FL=1
MRKLPARKLLGTIIAGALFLPHTGFTLGLGEIEVNSALNQALNADIQLLSASVEDTENLIIKLASRKEFIRAGLDRPYSLNDLRFKSEEINGVPYIKVSSGSPIREPFLNFLVEIDWPNGHLLREYTVLLDPPVFMTQPASTSPAPVSQTASSSDGSGFRPTSGGSTNVVPVVMPVATTSPRPMVQVPAQQIQPAPMAQAPVTHTNTQSSWVPAPVGKQPAVINQPAGSYRIKAGDTAWSLADAMRPDQSVSVSQMMVALLRANPESFINENINGLKRGYILRVPDYDQIAAIDHSDARAMVREQAALWRQYQQSQSSGQPVSAMEADAHAGTDDGSAANTGKEEDAYLEIVSAGSGASTTSGKDPTEMNSAELRAELALARERVETEQVEKEGLQQRVDQLEQHVEKMKGMLSIEDAELSAVQSLNASAQDELASDETVSDVMHDESTDKVALEETDTESMAEAAVVAPPAEDVMAEMPEENTKGSDRGLLFTDEAESDENMAEMPKATESADDSEVAQHQVDDQASEPDALTRLLNNPMMLAAVGGILLLLAGLIGLIIKRRKAAEEAEPVMSGFDDLEILADDVAEAEADAESLTGDQVLDSEESSEDDFDSDSTMMLDSAEDASVAEEDSSTALEDDAPRDDVIAEADVYLAYGIYQQAEELLVQAIADNPDRDDYQVKLAETYHASKNAEAFAEVAAEIKKRTDDINSPTWKKVMVMGQDICPDNPMFQGSMVSGLDADSLSPGTPSMDFDLGTDGLADAPDLDLSLDESPIELPDMDDVEETTAEAVDELEFDISDTGAVEETATEDEFSLDIDASELDIDIQDAVVETEESIDLGDVDLGLELDDDSAADEVLDIDDIDIDFGLEDDTDKTVTEEEVSLDLSDEVEASLDLTDEVATMDDDNSLDMALEEETTAASSDLDDDEDFDLSSLDDVDEISTKLDLARAYLDMGDHEGSRGILEEVLADGNDEQKQEANDLMAKLD